MATTVVRGRADRSARRRGRLLRRSFVAVAVVLALPAAWAVAVRTPLVRARVIDVVGASHMTRSRTLDLAGVSPSTNVVSVDPAAAAARLEADPWIAKATVDVRLPWTVRIALVERSPVLVVKEGRTHRLVAGDGTILGAPAPNAGTLPMLQTREGLGSSAAAPEIRSAASALALITPWARDAIRAVSVARDGSIRFELEGGGTILYGDDANAIAKARSLVAMLRWSQSHRGRFVSADLRVAGAPAARIEPRARD